MTYIYIVNVKDFRLEEESQSPGLLNGVGQLTVGLRKKTCAHINTKPKTTNTHKNKIKSGKILNNCKEICFIILQTV